MKKVLTFLIIATMLFITACGTSSGEQQTDNNQNNGVAQPEETEPITIRLGHVGSDRSGFQHAANHFKEKVSEKTDGNVTVEVFPGAQLGGDRDLAENVSNGSLSMGLISVGVFSNFTPAFLGVQLPFLVKNEDVEYQLYKSDVIAEKAMAELESFNMKGLALVQTGIFQFGSNVKPIHTPEDLDGLKIRSPENTMLVEAYETLGMSPIPMPYPDMYSALDTGVVDAGALQPSTWVTDRFAEVIDSVTLVNAIPWSAMFVINLDEFNNYPEEYQTAIQEAVIEAQDYMYEFERGFNEENVEAMKEMGVTIVDDAERTPFAEKMEPIYEKYANEHPIIAETIETVRELNSNN